MPGGEGRYARATAAGVWRGAASTGTRPDRWLVAPSMRRCGNEPRGNEPPAPIRAGACRFSRPGASRAEMLPLTTAVSCPPPSHTHQPPASGPRFPCCPGQRPQSVSPLNSHAPFWLTAHTGKHGREPRPQRLRHRRACADSTARHRRRHVPVGRVQQCGCRRRRHHVAHVQPPRPARRRDGRARRPRAPCQAARPTPLPCHHPQRDGRG